MGQFLYAIPNVRMVMEKLLEEVGLSSIFKDVIFSQRHTNKGPGGTECMLISIGDDAKTLLYKPDEQVWQQSLNGKYWLGLYENDRPTEESLRRKKQLAGHEIELADGAKWLIPIARIITGGSALPASLILGKNGEVIIEELPQYAKFCSKVENLWEFFIKKLSQYAQFSEETTKLWENLLNEFSDKKQETNFSLSEMINFAIEALAWNYFVGTEEVNLLKLITTQNLSEILAAIIDVPTLIEVAKQMKDEKKNRESADISDG